MRIDSAMQPWQESIQRSFESRNRREKAYTSIIENYRRLAARSARLAERNNALAISSALAKGGDNAAALAAAAAAGRQSGDYEGTISSLREELADLYKTQGQNAQRLVILNDTLRRFEEQARVDAEELKTLRSGHSSMTIRLTDLENLIKEKNRQIQLLQDELAMLNLEMHHIDERSKKLEMENKELTDRWTKMKETEAERMNEMNELLQSRQRRPQS